jgi:hypothetical protein
MMLLTLLSALALTVLAHNHEGTVTRFWPMPTGLSSVDSSMCNAYQDYYNYCKALIQNRATQVNFFTTAAPYDIPHDCFSLAASWGDVQKVCDWSSNTPSKTPTAAAAPTHAVDKRDFFCPQGTRYLTVFKETYDYYFCCPIANDQLLLPQAFASAPRCCNKGDKKCDGIAWSIVDWCYPGQEVTNYGGIVGCRALRRFNNEAQVESVPREVASRAARSILCPNHYKYFWAGSERYDYFFCCPQDDIKLSLSKDFKSPPRCCNLGDKCEETSVDIVDGCAKGFEVTEQAGIKGCRWEKSPDNQEDPPQKRDPSEQKDTDTGVCTMTPFSTHPPLSIPKSGTPTVTITVPAPTTLQTTTYSGGSSESRESITGVSFPTLMASIRVPGKSGQL